MTDGRRISGMIVVTICTASMAMARRSKCGMRKAMPIAISNNANHIMNCGKVMKGRVFSSNSETSGLAGLKSKSLSAPNQKKTMNIERRASGPLNLFKLLIMAVSIFGSNDSFM